VSSKDCTDQVSPVGVSRVDCICGSVDLEVLALLHYETVCLYVADERLRKLVALEHILGILGAGNSIKTTLHFTHAAGDVGHLLDRQHQGKAELVNTGLSDLNRSNGDIAVSEIDGVPFFTRHVHRDAPSNSQYKRPKR